jgi:hypothetical protein
MKLDKYGWDPQARFTLVIVAIGLLALIIQRLMAR